MNTVATDDFDWTRVVPGARFHHARYMVPGTRQPETCAVREIKKTAVRNGNRLAIVTRVFYVIGSTGEVVWNAKEEFPRVVGAWTDGPQ